MKKKLILLLVSVVAVMSLGGCSLFEKPTTESVLTKMQEAMADITSLDAALTLDMEMSMSAEGMEIPMAMEGEIDLAMVIKSEDESSTSVDGTLSINALGMEEEQVVQSYTVTEDGETTTYSWDTDYECWFKEVAEAEDEDEDRVLDIEKLQQILTLQEELEVYKDKECFVLNGTLDSDTIEDIADDVEDGLSLTEMLETFEDIDLEINLKLYVEKETYNPVSIVVTVPEIETEADGMEIAIETMNLELVLEGINTIDKIKIPKDAKNAEEKPEWDVEIDWGTDDGGVDVGVGETDDGDLILVPETDPSEPAVTPSIADAEAYAVAPWTELKMSIDGVGFALFDPYTTFESTGWYYDPAVNGVSEDYVLNSNEYSYATVEMLNAKYDRYSAECYIGFYNNTGSIQKLKDCVVWTVDFDVLWAMENGKRYPSVSIGGVQFGDTAETVTALLGTDCDTYYSELLGYTQYTYEVGYDKYFEITVYPNYGVTEMEIQCYP